MKLRLAICACLLAACAAFAVSPAQARTIGPMPPRLAAAEFLGFGAGFRLQGTHGYKVGFYAFSERPDGKGKIYVGVTREEQFRGGASYMAPAVVSEGFIKADLGSFGRVDLALHPSGIEKRIHIKCSKHTYPFETGYFDGVVEFKGEGSYTTVTAAHIPFRPPLTSLCGLGSGKGESRGPGLPGARLQGLSFAHGRRLTFQVNKNHPRRGRVPFSFELRERHEGIQIYRGVEGFAPSSSFSFEPDFSEAELSLPAPFFGSATLRRRPDAVTPSWTGDLSVDFVGHPNFRLAGPGVFVSLAHACFSYSGESSFAASC